MAKVELSVYASRAALRDEVAGRALTPYTPVHRTNGFAFCRRDLGCDARRRPGADPEPSRARPRLEAHSARPRPTPRAPLHQITPQGHLTPVEEATSSEGRRQWRHYGSHRDGQAIIPPTIAVPMLKRIAAGLNALFRPAMAPTALVVQGTLSRDSGSPRPRLLAEGEGR